MRFFPETLISGYSTRRPRREKHIGLRNKFLVFGNNHDTDNFTQNEMTDCVLLKWKLCESLIAPNLPRSFCLIRKNRKV
jgi:hypothetical protein